MTKHLVKYISQLHMLLLLLLLGSCANIGNPDGGPYDEEPPKVVGFSQPKTSNNGQTTTIEILFNEFVKLENASEKVVVSPPQINMPEITANGKIIKVKLLDSIKPNATYTIDFGDAIVDNNEGNPMGKYTYVFPTGEVVDTMQISGKVLNASNLEPIKGILVGLHSDTTDIAFNTKVFDRMARTNGSGEFTVKGVAPGKYRIYALKDADGDYKFTQKSEMIAFSQQIVKPSCFADVRVDTVWRDSTHIDSTVPVHYTHFVPDNIVLLAFTESALDRHFMYASRKVPEHFEVYFSGPSTEKPVIKGLNFDENQLVPQYSAKNDSITYWIKDTALVHTDTLIAELTFLENDSTGAFVSRTEPLELVSRLPRSRQIKLEQEAFKEWYQKQEKLKKKGRPYQTVMPPAKLEITSNSAGTLDADQNIVFNSPEPLAYIDTSKIHLYLKEDTLYYPAPHEVVFKSGNSRSCELRAEWWENQKYLLSIDSAAFVSIYGKVSDKIESNFSIPDIDTYSSVFVNIAGVSDTSVVVQLLNNGDKVVKEARTKNGTAEFYRIKPGSFYMRAFVDRNGNGVWDEGNYANNQQAEEVYYYPRSFNLRAKWDDTLNWDMKSLPLTRQKPAAITKQKPDREKKIQNRNVERNKKWKNAK